MALQPNLNPHQFALPGMEEHAHPFAKQLAAGLMLRHKTLPGSNGNHSLVAYNPDTGEKHGNLQWQSQAGGEQKGDGNYPGHVDWAGNKSSEEARAAGRTPPHPGLATALFHSAHTFDFGQDTVPVHSPFRTKEGDKFAARVRPDLAPPSMRTGSGSDADDRKARQKAVAWRPPTGIHPYEQQSSAAKAAKQQAAVAAIKGPPQARGQTALVNAKQFSGGKNKKQRVMDGMKAAAL